MTAPCNFFDQKTTSNHLPPPVKKRSFRERFKSRSTETLSNPKTVNETTNAQNKFVGKAAQIIPKTIYCEAINKYSGLPKPPINHPLLFESGDILQITNFNDSNGFMV